jgi:uncharacterized cupredoxin-like copper-binding protein
MNRKTALFAGATSLVFSSAAWVHHSGAMFDGSKKQELVGIISEFNWTNPHASFKIDVTDAQGAVTIWAVEMGSPNNMIHDGWKRSTLKPGTQVTVVVTPLRNGKPGGSFVSATFPDGRKLGMQPPASGSGYGAATPAKP